MSPDWPTRPDEAPAILSFVAILVVLLVTVLLGGDELRPSAIRLALPAFVPLDAESAREVAGELGAAFREYMGAEHDGGRGMA